MSGATLTGVDSGSITGTPSALPSNWSLVDGYFIGPQAYLYDANLTGANRNVPTTLRQVAREF
jgi:hypothetical protein